MDDLAKLGPSVLLEIWGERAVMASITKTLLQTIV
jgi:hypothetical protein